MSEFEKELHKYFEGRVNTVEITGFKHMFKHFWDAGIRSQQVKTKTNSPTIIVNKKLWEQIHDRANKLEEENKALRRLANNAECFASFYKETCDDEEDERFVKWWLGELKKLKSEG